MSTPTLGLIAVLDTSTARNVQYDASQRLLELLEEGYTVYIASTRTKLSPDTYDKCLFDLIPEEQFFTANPAMEVGHAKAEGLIDLWERVLTHLGIEIPENTSEWGRSWMGLRYIAQDAGITIK